NSGGTPTPTHILFGSSTSGAMTSAAGSSMKVGFSPSTDTSETNELCNSSIVGGTSSTSSCVTRGGTNLTCSGIVILGGGGTFTSICGGGGRTLTGPFSFSATGGNSPSNILLTEG